MKKIIDKELKRRFEKLVRKQLSAEGSLAFHASVGRTIKDLAVLLDVPEREVLLRLSQWAIDKCSTENNEDLIPGLTEKAIQQILDDHSPKQPDPDYVAEYESWGHSKDAADCMAVAYQAWENALDAAAK